MVSRQPHRLSRQQRRRLSGPIAVTAFSRAVFDAERGGLSRQTKLILRVLAGGALLYLFVAGNMGVLKMLDLWRSERSLTRRDTRLAAQVLSLDTRRRMLESDTTYIEKIARTEYHLSRPGEVIYEIEKPTP
jgi:cell division protein FtsB